MQTISKIINSIKTWIGIKETPLSMSKINTALNDWRRISETNSPQEIEYISKLTDSEKEAYAAKWESADELIQNLYLQILEMKKAR